MERLQEFAGLDSLAQIDHRVVVPVAEARRVGE
jgi:hypothetical protein